MLKVQSGHQIKSHAFIIYWASTMNSPLVQVFAQPQDNSMPNTPFLYFFAIPLLFPCRSSGYWFFLGFFFFEGWAWAVGAYWAPPGCSSICWNIRKVTSVSRFFHIDNSSHVYEIIIHYLTMSVVLKEAFCLLAVGKHTRELSVSPIGEH